MPSVLCKLMTREGTLILIPLYHKIGRRPVMLLSMAIVSTVPMRDRIDADVSKYAAGLLGATQAKSFSGLMVARVFHAFGSCVCEALPAQIVNDIFFLHERGWRLGFYTGESSRHVGWISTDPGSQWHYALVQLVLYTPGTCSRAVIRGDFSSGWSLRSLWRY